MICFQTESYEVFWEVIEGYLTALFEEFYKGNRLLNSMKFRTINLLPKTNVAKNLTIQTNLFANCDFHFFLLKSSYKYDCFGSSKNICPSQATFLLGRILWRGLVFCTKQFMNCIGKCLIGLCSKLILGKLMIKLS